ncbi:MAG: GH1 family beta-glucosidase [Candidatus Bathyarchaeota archaeon]|nr:GH1 family beta-glucosidase [Candidatus Bathyarchaeota archaeon]
MELLHLSFPRGFLLGTASASYQIEGAVAEDGRGPSIWDTFSHTPGKIEDSTNGDKACEHYYRWWEDVELMKKLGVNAYRFSISWSRVLPKGRGKINNKGLQFYSNLVDALLEAGITPFVTLYHFDLPQALQDEGGGWLRRGIVDDFEDYTDAVSVELGDRVKHWTTINEPWELAWQGYVTGEDAPGLRLGNDAALKASHNIMLAHGAAVRTLRDNSQGAELGIVLHLNMVEPASDHPEDLAAAHRWELCQNRWYMDALYREGYPTEMVKLFGRDAPEVIPGDMEQIHEQIDFLGVNNYRRSVVAAGNDLPPVNMRRVSPPGEYTEMDWEVHPEGLYKILKWVHANYPVPRVYVTENGASFTDIMTPDGKIHDERRVAYLRDHIQNAHRAMREGVPLKGYFAWSTMDNFEWAYGYSRRFGVVYIDYETQKRTIKDSGRFLSKVAKTIKQ